MCELIVIPPHPIIFCKHAMYVIYLMFKKTMRKFRFFQDQPQYARQWVPCMAKYLSN